MDRYDPYTDKFLRDTQYGIHGTNLAEVGTDLISRQAAIETVMECYDNDELFEVYEDKLRELPPAQPELIEKAAYIRGFEQGRTQGMIDSHGGKK